MSMRVLLVDADGARADALATVLRDVDGGVEVVRAPTLDADAEALPGAPIDAAIVSLRDAADLPLVAAVRARSPSSAILVMVDDAGSRLAELARDCGSHGALLDGAVDAPSLDRRLARALEAARIRRAHEEIVTVISHDLRNPLNVVTVAAASLQQGTIPPARIEAYLAKIRRAADRMNRMIQDIVDASRLEGGVLAMHPTLESPAQIVDDVVAGQRAAAEEKGVRLDAVIDGPLPSVWADRARMAQALTHLVVNAIQLTPAGGSVRVAARASDAAEGASVRFEVEDTGPGIAPERLPHMFQRVEHGARSDRRGAGFGLAIARSIASLHHGEIGVESALGGGATFFIVVPTAGGAAPGQT